jgi:3-methyladenine DNA glycosylase AlkD
MPVTTPAGASPKSRMGTQRMKTHKTPPTAAAIRRRLHALAEPAVAAHSARFFKTGAGEYGAGDRFLGVRVPVLRKLARECRDATAATAFGLLRSAWHEERLLALLMLVRLFERADEAPRARIYTGYVRAIARHVNNWDLVDTSAPAIVGGYLAEHSRRPLYRLARSRNLWERRVAIMATLTFIRQRSFDDTLALAELLLDDDHDLIHKATGWMLREVGNRDTAILERFLDRRCARMPRTMLRYAIEKLPPRRRRIYLRARSG